MSSTCNTCNAFPACRFWPMESLQFAASDSQEQQLLKSGWTRSWIVMEFSWEPTYAKAWMPRCCTWIGKTLPAEKWLIYSETSGGMMTEVAWEYYRNYVVELWFAFLNFRWLVYSDRRDSIVSAPDNDIAVDIAMLSKLWQRKVKRTQWITIIQQV